MKMNRFWDEVIGPLARAAQPKIIVEVGSDYGVGTEKLLHLCKESGALLHVIDPVPKYDADEWSARWGDSLVFHRDLSLNALSRIAPMDFVLLDGDHNWYTVRNELELIYEQTVERGDAFPLILLHDVGWPYGRRDLYYDPSNIPDEFKQPHAAMGIIPGQSELAPGRGMNGHHYNALSEGTPRNGVRTGIEDFINDHEDGFTFIVIPAFFGLGILYRTRDIVDGPLKATLDGLAMTPAIEALSQRAERERVNLTVEHHERLANHEVVQARIESVDRMIETNQAAMAELSNKLYQSRNELYQSRRETTEARQRLAALEASNAMRVIRKLSQLAGRAPRATAVGKKLLRQAWRAASVARNQLRHR